MGIIIRFFTYVFVAPFASAWSLMIAIGIVHLHGLPALAPMGFSSCLGIAYASTVALSIVGGLTLLAGGADHMGLY